MAKKKTDDSAYKQLKQDLTQGTLGNLYLLHGEETYLRDYYLARMKEQLVGGPMEQFNLHQLTEKDFSPEALEQAMDNLPMMSQRTLVLVSDVALFKTTDQDEKEDKEREEQDNRTMEALTELFGRIPDYCCVVFLYDVIPFKFNGRTKLGLSIKANGSVVEFARQEQSDLVDWVCRRFRAQKKQIDRELARYLIFYCGDLMNTLIGEIEKIAAYARGERITKQDIDTVATPELDAVAYALSDAVGAGKYDDAAGILGELLEMQQPPLMLVYVLGKHMRKLYSARLMLERRDSEEDLLELWGLKDFPRRKLMDSARQVSLSWCRKAVCLCTEAELKMKSVRGLDERQVLSGLLLDLAALDRR